MRSIALSLLSLWAVAVLGCAQQSNSVPFGAGSSTAAGVGSAPLVAPTGPFARGMADPTLSPDPTTIGPNLEILSPARGSQSTAAQVSVQVKANDADGVSAVTIAGTPASSLGGDTYEQQVTLAQGLNVVPVTAVDMLGNVSTCYASVIHGQFRPVDTLLDQTIGASLNDVAMARVADVAAQALKDNYDLFDLVQTHNPLYDSSTLDLIGTGLTYSDITADLDATTNGINATLYLENPVLDLDVSLFGGALTAAQVTATRATATIDATIDRSALAQVGPHNTALGLEVNSIDVTFSGFRVTTTNSVLSSLLGPFQGLIRSVVGDLLEDILNDLAADLLTGSLTGFDAPLTLNLPRPEFDGQPNPGTADLDLLFQVDHAKGFPGVELELLAGFKADVQNPVPGRSDQVLFTGAKADMAAAAGPQDFTVVASVDALNGVFHTLWLSGALGLVIDGTKPIPADASLRANARLLHPFLPPTRALIPDPETPIHVELSLEAPPLLQFGTATAPACFSVAELQIKILVDYMDGGPNVELFTLRAAATFCIDLSLVNMELTIDKLTLDSFQADVVNEPTVDLADQEVENFLHTILPDVLDKFADEFPTIPLPALPYGINLTNPSIEGVPDLLLIKGNL